MSRKKRIFDIDMPEEADPALQVSQPGLRRGPMASAIAENAEAVQARRDAETAIRAENDSLAHEYVRLRDAGLVVAEIPLDDVHTHLLVRDRMPGQDYELPELVTSIRELGLSNPIRVEPRADGDGYELIQGFRRLSAYRVLHADGDGWSTIPALVLPRGEGVAGLYRRMVDENVIRKDLSFAEMAYVAQNYAADPATPEQDLRGAIATLFQSAPYSKRSYIKSFATLLDRIGGALAYPTEIPRKLGVDLARAIDDNPGIVDRVRDDLRDWDNRSVQDELTVLRRYAGDLPDAPATAPSKSRGKTKTRTTFNLATSRGHVKCTAAEGRLEIKLDRDFSTMDRARLERAIAALVDGLE
ncbi:chromosome partitioning protein, ParB family [Loktanella sp. DSM 29012]|uniref:ParB/RepB/Spo0J family partition protein n=1 Tax=Loktanella sp. DSM 29012 TaxID=1881056 RepID=UPI0008C777D5|nr:ParB N-terminal domain-containing protein [Loktanella sp. DSM 29012]SEQ83415.1 chromosome partitioning protein, ParB family [Loktanella sp. DSM 29012]